MADSQKRLSIWVSAARPRTLAAALVPVGVGTALALAMGFFEARAAGVCMAFALLVQVGTNFANDYFDYMKGADTPERLGPVRAVASGAVSPTAMRRATALVFACAFGVGLLLIPYGGWGLLPLGVLCVVCGVAYTGGPFPLAYNGLGEVFVLVFFGVVATAGTFYVQAGGFPVVDGIDTLHVSLSAGMGVGALACTILVVNNLRDRFTDASAGKRTLAVRFGARFSRTEYAGLASVALLASLNLSSLLENAAPALPCLLLPWYAKLWRCLRGAENSAQWNRLLGASAAALLAYGALMAAGILWASPA